jgi:hypothetical protein
MFNPANVDPNTDSSVADKLRKQSKSRAVRFIREALAKPDTELTIHALRGHEGAYGVLPVVTEAARKLFKPITHSAVQEAIVFRAADRSTSGRSDHAGEGLEGKDDLPAQSKPKKPRQTPDADAKKAASHARTTSDMSIGMLLSDAQSDASPFSSSKRSTGVQRLSAGQDDMMVDVDDYGASAGRDGLGDGSPADSSKKKKDPNRAQRDKNKIVASQAALETFDAEPVYVVGTGPACDIKKTGILRKIGGFIKIECEGQIIGLKEFCNLAQNKKQVARDGVRLVSNDMTLTEAIDQVLVSRESEFLAIAKDGVSSPHVHGKAASSSTSDAAKPSPAAGGTPGGGPPKKKKKSENAAAAAAVLAQSAAKKLFESSSGFNTDEDALSAYNQDKVDFKAVVLEDRNEQIRLKKEKDILKCKALVKSIISNRQGALFLKPVDTNEFPDYTTKVSQPMDLGTVRNMLEQGICVSHEDFARDMRLVWSNAIAYHPPDSEMSEFARKLSDTFEERYATISAEAASVEDAMDISELPEDLLSIPQRRIQDWAIFDASGNFLTPWSCSEASSPGGVCGTAVAAGNADAPTLHFRLDSPQACHARCVDPLGNQLPEFWVKTEKAWYMLGKPIDAYKDFLLEESAWVMATYRVAAYLIHSSRASFDDVCRVLEGKGWRKGDKLVPHSIDVLIKNAESVVAEIRNIQPKFAGHKFCTTLLQKAQRLREIRSGPRRRESKGETSTKKRKASDAELAEDEDLSMLPDCGGWQWHDDLSDDEKEVRRALHGVICALERDDGTPKKKHKGGRKSGSKSDWRCHWCSATVEQAGGKSPGPDGPGTLCPPCGSRFRHGHKGPPQQDGDGWFVCDLCNKTFQSIRGLGSHRRSCVGAEWRCDWCGCLEQETSTKCQGPRYVRIHVVLVPL